jgi:hypothetical protein
MIRISGDARAENKGALKGYKALKRVALKGRDRRNKGPHKGQRFIYFPPYNVKKYLFLFLCVCSEPLPRHPSP